VAVDKKSSTHSEDPSDDEVEYDDEDDHGPSFYDKSKSFFDNISCDATEKAQGYGSVTCACFADCDSCSLH